MLEKHMFLTALTRNDAFVMNRISAGERNAAVAAAAVKATEPPK
jgi:hypothetical protein